MMPRAVFALCVAGALCGLLDQEVRGMHVGDGGPLRTTVGKFSDLTFKISTSRSSFLPLEPIPLNVLVANPTAEPVAGHRVKAPDGQVCKVFVSRNGGPFTEFCSRDGDQRGEPPRRLIPAGFRKEVPGYLHYGRAGKQGEEKYFLPESGVYQIKCTLSNPDGTVTLESNVLTLDVAMPQGVDAAAYAYLRSVPHRGFLLLWEGGRLGAGVWDSPALKDLEAFADEYSESRYAAYACYALGMMYGPWGRTDGEKQKGKAFLQKATALDNPFFADNALSKLVDLYGRCGELNAAEQVLVKLLGRSGNRDLVWRTWEELRRAIGRSSPLQYRVTVNLEADWAALEHRPDLDRIAICLDAKDVGYLPMAGKALENGARWKEPRAFTVPAGTYRVSLRGGQSEANMIGRYVVLAREVKVKGDMPLAVTVTREHLTKLELRLVAQGNQPSEQGAVDEDVPAPSRGEGVTVVKPPKDKETDEEKAPPKEDSTGGATDPPSAKP